jgi:hypothetical protein
METWDEARLQAYIDSFIEESLTLDYKAAGSFALTDGKRKEITKDVSAMANSAGGILIYGVKEYADPERKHLAETIDPIDRTSFSKEWLEQVINNIRPHIHNILIHPISLSSSPNDVAYVVEIPQSTTAHQAQDHRYYKRFNFLSEPMEDYEIRDIMNRATTSDAAVEFSYSRNSITSSEHHYTLAVKIKNRGNQVINHFQLQFTFPQWDGNVDHIIHKRDHIDCWQPSANLLMIRYRSNKVLFPEEEIDVGQEMAIQYMVNGPIYGMLDGRRVPMVDWTLYADNMIPKTGAIRFEDLQCF